MSSIMRLNRSLKWLILSLKRDRGASLAEFALLLPLLGLLLFGVIDFGRAFYLGIELNNAAYTGALYGVQNRTDITGMEKTATADAADFTGMTAVATQGCECSDGTNVVSSACTTSTLPTCGTGTSVVFFVTVTTTGTYTTIIPWPRIPSTLALTGTAKLRASQ
jgi:Flp pilus assembly protein TadG